MKTWSKNMELKNLLCSTLSWMLQFSNFCLAKRKSGRHPEIIWKQKKRGNRSNQANAGWPIPAFTSSWPMLKVCHLHLLGTILDSSNLMSFVQKSLGELPSHLEPQEHLKTPDAQFDRLSCLSPAPHFQSLPPAVAPPPLVQ